MDRKTFEKKYEKVKGITWRTKAGNVIDASEYKGLTQINRVLNFCPYAFVNGNVLYVRAIWGDLACKEGDFIIRYSESDYGVCDRKVFFETYERA